MLADEKHTSLKGDKVFVATTVANGCILGAEVCSNAYQDALTKGYKVFADEARNVDPEYSPETVNTDGWDATRLAFEGLFINIVVIRCFLHAFIKIRDCCKKHLLFKLICSKIWDVYESESKAKFSQSLRRFKTWAEANLAGKTALNKIISVYNRSKEYQLAYDYPDCHRTSNMCDRLMRFLDRTLFVRQKFHGTLESATDMTHAWAILRNFYPYCQRKTGPTKDLICPASELNGFSYSDNWLKNLITSTSMNGYRQ
jgi:hypothetical protein